MGFQMYRILHVVALLGAVFALDHYYRDAVPRFKTAYIPRHEVYLGDRVRLSCQTLSKSPTTIEWYRNGQPVGEELLHLDRVHTDLRHMSLEIREIDVSDQGLWACKVHNDVAQISRNFTIEVIDFCDYFLIPQIDRKRIPMECICLWHYTREVKRSDIDFSVATEQTCNKYASRMINRARKPFATFPCFEPPCDANGNPLPRSTVRPRTRTTSHAISTVSNAIKPLHELDEPKDVKKTKHDYIEEDEEDVITNEMTAPDSTPVLVNITVETAPSFKETEILSESVAVPAGRTLRLTCKASGNPDPKIVWYKDHILITKDRQRTAGLEYKIRRWQIELEDAVEADSGLYSCEAWNNVGAVNKTFNVTIVNRMRRPPFIVPNILKNQTVSVNGTAKFHCKVVSDLLPHIMWVRINKVNGSYHYYNSTASEFMFNYTEMDRMENAHVHHKGDESSLTLVNVTLEDQGLYACLSGNTLGTTMANATLTVNDYLAYNLPTGDEPNYNRWNSVFTIGIIILILLMTLLIALMAYYLWYRFNSKQRDLDDTRSLMPKKKKVIVTHKKMFPEDGVTDLLSTYQIQIVEATSASKGSNSRTRQRANSDNTAISEYEVDPDPEWEIDRSRLQMSEVLGEGAFGEVWRAVLLPEEKSHAEMPVAVKKLKASAHEKELIDLVSEMETFKVIGHHENLLRLVGCCTGSGPLFVVLELCRHGNLRDFLRAHRPKDEKQAAAKKLSGDLDDYLEPRKISENKDGIDLIKHLTQRHLVQFAWQVAKGMDFMAKRKFIHRDLAARNVLVADNHVLKISDFGLSRDVHCNDYYRKKGNGRLPIKWMALEALDSHVYTIESDVWSFGILLWEIMTLGGTPYPTIAMPKLYSNLKEGYRMEAPHNCPEEVYNIMVACWQEKREYRPSFDTIMNYLDWMLAQSAEIASDDLVNLHEELPLSQVPSEQHSPSTNSTGFPKRRKLRPLSAPVNLPSDPQHSICDDEPDDPAHGEVHNYCNDRSSPRQHVLERQKTDPGSEDVLGGSLAQDNPGYVRSAALSRLANEANLSRDSAIGSPIWHSYDRTSNHCLTGGACLGEATQVRERTYMNVYPNYATKSYFNFSVDAVKNDNMNRSKDSAICDVCHYSSTCKCAQHSFSTPQYSFIPNKWSTMPGYQPDNDNETIV